MDFKKMNIPTLGGPNWGAYSTQLQAAAQILGFWEIIKGEALATMPVTYDHLPKPTTGQGGSHPDANNYAIVKVDWSKRNGGALGLIQATTSVVIWQDFVSYSKYALLWEELEKRFRKVGGATTYLQLVNMVNIQFTNSTDLLPQIQAYQDNYTQILSNGHSQLSKDLTTFMFCSHLPKGYI